MGKYKVISVRSAVADWQLASPTRFRDDSRIHAEHCSTTQEGAEVWHSKESTSRRQASKNSESAVLLNVPKFHGT